MGDGMPCPLYFFLCKMVMLVLCCHVMMLNLAMILRLTPFRQDKGIEAYLKK